MNENNNIIDNTNESIDIGKAIVEIIEICAKSESIDSKEVADYVTKFLTSRYGLKAAEDSFKISKDSLNDIINSLFEGKSPIVLSPKVKLDNNYDNLYSEVLKRQEQQRNSSDNEQLIMQPENNSDFSIYSQECLHLVEEDKNMTELNLEDQKSHPLERVKKKETSNPWESAGDPIAPGSLFK